MSIEKIASAYLWAPSAGEGREGKAGHWRKRRSQPIPVTDDVPSTFIDLPPNNPFTEPFIQLGHARLCSERRGPITEAVYRSKPSLIGGLRTEHKAAQTLLLSMYNWSSQLIGKYLQHKSLISHFHLKDEGWMYRRHKRKGGFKLSS